MYICNRRTAIQSATKLVAATSLSAAVQAETRPVDKSTIVDTHLHCFAGNDARFPYAPRAPYQPSQAATPEHLLQCMDEAGVHFAIIVHPEPYQDDHRYLEHCLAIGQERVKGVCLFFAELGHSVGAMRALIARNPGRIVAARVHAYAPDRLPPFGKPELRNLWTIAADLGLAIQLHFEPRYAPGFESLIEEFRDTRVIIDHLGRPMQGTTAEHEVVVRWSRFPNTVMKISSLPDRNVYPHRDVGPIIRQLTTAYGAQRLIYGGGFSADATGESYRSYRQKVEQAVSHLSATDQALVLGENAVRLFGFQSAQT
jgi:predicted TIM-barrel fold metal-dependent hydrolase